LNQHHKQDEKQPRRRGQHRKQDGNKPSQPATTIYGVCFEDLLKVDPDDSHLKDDETPPSFFI
jgi:hypothetical protein